jgi:hypothetical protein
MNDELKANCFYFIVHRSALIVHACVSAARSTAFNT